MFEQWLYTVHENLIGFSIMKYIGQLIIVRIDDFCVHRNRKIFFVIHLHCLWPIVKLIFDPNLEYVSVYALMVVAKWKVCLILRLIWFGKSFFHLKTFCLHLDVDEWDLNSKTWDLRYHCLWCFSSIGIMETMSSPHFCQLASNNYIHI